MSQIKRGYTSGVWDLFHAGHVRSIKIAKDHCDYLIVGITSDESCEQYKRTPMIPFNQRWEIIACLAVVDEIIEAPNYPTPEFYNRHRIDICIQGDPHPGSGFYNTAEKLGIMKYVDYQKITNTTQIINRINNLTMNQKISVIMPSYNAADYIGDALDSILSQLLDTAEIIIVDDSSDNTPDIVGEYDDPRIQLIHNKNKMGISNARNMGIAVATGTLIAFHDADDISKPGRFEAQLAFLNANPHIAMVGGGVDIMDFDGTTTAEKLPKKNPSKTRQFKSNCFRTSSIIVTAEALKQVGGFNPVLQYGEDWDLWNRINKQFQTANLQQIIYTYRKTPSGITSRESKNTILWDTLVHCLALDYIGTYGVQTIQRDGIENFATTMPKKAKAYYLNKKYLHHKSGGEYQLAYRYAKELYELPGFSFGNWLQMKKSQRNLDKK